MDLTSRKAGPPGQGRLAARRFSLAVLALLVLLLSARLAFVVSEHQGVAAARAEANHKLDLFAAAVDGVIKRLEHVPATIQLNQEVQMLLHQPNDRRRLAAANNYLRRLNAHLGSISAFVLNDRGVVLASSNSELADDSLIGEDLAFRPYFLDALSGKVGRHFAIGIRGNQPGYFVSHPIHDGSRVVGVAAIKISLNAIDRTWEMLGAPALLSDTNEVVILASDPSWRYTAMSELPLERRVDLQLNQMYNSLRIPRFPLALELSSDDDSVVLDGANRRGMAAGRRVSDGSVLVLRRTLDGMDWRLTIFADLRAVHQQAVVNSFMAAVATGFVLLLGLHLVQRRRSLRQKFEAKLLLERANAELEQKVAERTVDLTAANARLRTEVTEREQAEQTLRATQGELVQAAKMAVVGQLAAGITHELTQPLGAIRTLSGNAIEFLRRGDSRVSQDNLQIIGRLADQMGSIIQPLKAFARKSQPAPEPTDVAHAVRNALFLFDLPLRKAGVQVDNRCQPGDCIAWCEPNRLEQVMINLIGNAADAMAQVACKQLILSARRVPAQGDEPAGVCIEVQDSGCGLGDNVRQQLFEPFFTTKPRGAGLGLGLAVSRDIVREFNGDIRAESRPDGGARFTVHLPAAPLPLLKTASPCCAK